jgi:peroxidase
MRNYAALLLFFILTAGSLFILIYAPVTAGADIPMVFGLAFSTGLPNYEYQERLCPRKTDWELASNERNLSNLYFSQDEPIPDSRGLSNLIWVWGQFIDHDIVHSITNATAPIYHLDNFNLTRVQSSDGEPRTTISPMIDAGTIYGDYLNILNLRDNNLCKFRTSIGNLLPVVNSSFLSGDDRNSEHSQLTSLHTLWMREHNRLCDVIGIMAPSFNEEEKFWKARQIVIGKIQHITYEEWLPALFGDQIGLIDSVTEKGTGLRLSAEFGTVAFRFGHSMVSETIGPFSLLQTFFNITMIQQYGIDVFLNASMYEHSQAVDTKVVNNLRNIMFGAEDLITRNLFRGRETGSGTYQMLAQCFGFYAYPINAQDPLLGLLAEPLAQGSSLPVGLATIVAEQFKRLRKYDRYFYSASSESIGSYFYREILETTIASVIKANTNLKNIKPKGFYVE